MSPGQMSTVDDGVPVPRAPIPMDADVLFNVPATDAVVPADDLAANTVAAEAAGRRPATKAHVACVASAELAAMAAKAPPDAMPTDHLPAVETVSS